MKHLLFICSQNRLRSPTAEQVFSAYPGVVCASAGLNHDAENPVTPELLEWAEIVFVMEKAHRNRLSARFRRYLGRARIVCLDIPDDYGFMDPVLVRLLEAEPSVLDLLAEDPFEGARPRFVRARVWDYRFGDVERWEERDEYWVIEELGAYSPTLRGY